jgi:SAM-dependent methyltransferase
MEKQLKAIETSTLNVGCGPDCWGDVRLDIYKECKPTLIGDAQFLPFVENCFKTVKISHCLEHLENPSRALGECLRVTKEKVILAFPTDRDMKPIIVRFLFSLPFSIRGVSYWVNFTKNRVHKWVIKPEAVTRFFEQHGWECSVSFEKGKTLFSVFESKRTPRRLRLLANYVPRVRQGYVIECSRSFLSE